MRTLIATLVLVSLTGCGSNDAEIIKNVCVPINENSELKSEDLARQKGYDVEEVHAVCRAYLRKRLQEIGDMGRQLNGDNTDPFAKD